MTSNSYLIILALILCGAISFSINYFLIRHAKKLHLIDAPNHRSSHTMPTPRGGGIGIVLGYSCCSFLLWTLLGHGILIWIMLLIGWIMAAVGFQDDIVSSPALVKLAFQMLAMTLLLLSLEHFTPTSFHFTAPLSYLVWSLAFFSGLWLINLYNFMDGIDGLAASEGIFVLLAAGFSLYYQNTHSIITPYCFLLASACLGFLCWNLPRAKIFMGDTGSLYLGFLMVFFATYTVFHQQLSLSCWLIWLSLFWIDATYTLIIRLATKQRFYAAHRSHLYQILSRKLKTHGRVSWIYTAYNLLYLFPLSLLSMHYSRLNGLWVFMAIAPILLSAIVYGAGRLHTGECRNSEADTVGSF